MSLKRIGKPGGGAVLLHTCEVCGADATFGIGVQFRQALGKLAAGNIASARRHLGRWYCGGHRPAGGDGAA